MALATGAGRVREAPAARIDTGTTVRATTDNATPSQPPPATRRRSSHTHHQPPRPAPRLPSPTPVSADRSTSRSRPDTENTTRSGENPSTTVHHRRIGRSTDRPAAGRRAGEPESRRDSPPPSIHPRTGLAQGRPSGFLVHRTGLRVRCSVGASHEGRPGSVRLGSEAQSSVSSARNESSWTRRETGTRGGAGAGAGPQGRPAAAADRIPATAHARPPAVRRSRAAIHRPTSSTHRRSGRRLRRPVRMTPC